MEWRPLFEEACAAVGALERRVRELEEALQHKRLQIEKLQRPLVWITGGESRTTAARRLLESREPSSSSVVSDHVVLHGYYVDNKYFTAHVNILCTPRGSSPFLLLEEANDLEMPSRAVQAAVLVFEDDAENSHFTELEASEYLLTLTRHGRDPLPEVLLCYFPSSEVPEEVLGRAAAWCVENGVELVESGIDIPGEKSGLDRVMEALDNVRWVGMEMKGTKRTQALVETTPKAMNERARSNEETASTTVTEALERHEVETEALVGLMTRMQELRTSGGTLSDADRRERAAQLAMEMATMLDLEEEEEEEISHMR